MIERMFEKFGALLHGRGESPAECELRRLLDSVEWRLAGDLDPHLDAAVRAISEGRPRDGVDERIAAGAARLDRLVTDGGFHLAAAQEARRAAAGAAAAQARALAAFARARPSSFDRPDGEIGAAAAATRAARPAVLAPVSEWAVDEVMVGLHLTREAASALLVDSLLLVERLPATLDALETGRITWEHARVMTDLVARLGNDVRAEAERRLLATADGKTRAQLRVAARRLVQRLDAAAVARRVVDAIRDRRVTVYPGDDGMATLSAVLPQPVARAVQDALRRYADAAAVEGDERTREQRMVDCLVDLVLRPGEHGLAPVQAQLTVVASVETLLGGDEPGEVDGDLVPAETVRQLAVALGLMPPAGPADDADGAGGVEAAGPVAPAEATSGRTDGAEVTAPAEVTSGGTGGAEVAAPAAPSVQDDAERRAALAELLNTRDVRGTTLARRVHVALVDELSGQLVALTDALGLRAGRALGPPPETPGYACSAGLDRFVRLRDRRCRFPGCRARPVRCDLDHTVPYPSGPTAHDNLCCLCRHHHRLSHQAPGWNLRGLADGGLEWTTPSGQSITTRPPTFGTDDDLPLDPASGAAASPGPTPRPAVLDVPDDDPPPF